MAESTVVMRVCDICGEPASAILSWRDQGKGRTNDLCSKHMKALRDSAVAPRRGRKPGATVVKRTTKMTSRKKTTSRKTLAKKTSARRGRPRKASVTK